MMATYYYLIASLPDLTTDGGLPVSYDEFITMCEGNVSEDKFEIIKNLTLQSSKNFTKGPSLLRKWSKFYKGLTRELNTQRAMALGQSYQAEYDKDPMTTLIAQAAMNARTPLEAETILLEHEFEALDHFMGGHDYDDEQLFGYAIKLKLLERRSCFEKEKGKAEFKRLFDSVQQSVYNL